MFFTFPKPVANTIFLETSGNGAFCHVAFLLPIFSIPFGNAQILPECRMGQIAVSIYSSPIHPARSKCC